MTDAIEVSGLSKIYKSGTKALAGIDLRSETGKLLTVIGKNGTGKTTMIRILTTQLMPSSGSARILGYDVVSQAKEVKHHIALVPQEAQTNQSMSPWDYVYYLTMLEGISSNEAKSRARDALEIVGLGEISHKPCYALSGGERRRAIVAAAVASKAEVLFLDEPTTGMDPIIRRQIWASLRRMVERGQTIVLTTHLMEEAEFVSDRIAIIYQGSFLASVTPGEIKAKVNAKARVVIGGDHTEEFGSFGEVGKVGDRQILLLDQASDARKVVDLPPSKGLSAEVSPGTPEDGFCKLPRGPAH